MTRLLLRKTITTDGLSWSGERNIQKKSATSFVSEICWKKTSYEKNKCSWYAEMCTTL